jgi:hypothetical protein
MSQPSPSPKPYPIGCNATGNLVSQVLRQENSVVLAAKKTCEKPSRGYLELAGYALHHNMLLVSFVRQFLPRSAYFFKSCSWEKLW